MTVLTPAFINASFYTIAAVAGVFMLAGRYLCRGSSSAAEGGPDFRRFQWTYLAIYLIATFADWLQGAYVYALYKSYGYTDAENGQLFVAGFGASMVFGTFAGSWTDRAGRRKGAYLYCLLYILSCASKHFSSYWVLMFGRVTGGVATSLLFSVFDSWLVSEHFSREYDPELLGKTFGLAVFSNSVTAILAGKVAQFSADAMELTPPALIGKNGMLVNPPKTEFHVGGNLGPFDVSIAALIICAILLKVLWVENVGDGTDGSLASAAGCGISALKEATVQTITKLDVLCCGIVCSFFEASMFIFVFKWTPCVTDPNGPIPPYGEIFATFMVACMLGSRIYSVASNYLSVEKIGVCLLFFAACAHGAVVLSGDPVTSFLAFLVIEGCVGIYFPMIGTMKGAIVPEESRATIYNLYRVPLNLAVCGALLMQLSVFATFCTTTALLLVALVAQCVLACRQSAQYKSYDDTSYSTEAEMKSVVAADALGKPTNSAKEEGDEDENKPMTPAVLGGLPLEAYDDDEV